MRVCVLLWFITEGQPGKCGGNIFYFFFIFFAKLIMSFCSSWDELALSVSLAQLEIPSNFDKLAKGTPVFTIVSVCLCVCLCVWQPKINWQDKMLNTSATTGLILPKFET